MSLLRKEFKAVIKKSPNKGGWSYVLWPDSVKFFKTKGLVKVKGSIDGVPFKSSFMAMGNGFHMLPIRASIRKIIKKEVGNTILIKLKERIN